MTDDSSAATGRVRRAIAYLRVSTTSQVNTDYDPEGISIPAQRKACERKIAQMENVILVDEYREPGASGTSMDKRPAFQAMLHRIRTERDVDIVVIYKLSRMNRNRLDDALTIAELRKYGVQLVSATESIDETPVGQLMHGILASFNEFRSAEDGADIRYKMGEKAKRGGTLGRAPLGYLNVRENFEGREIRTVAIDPERAPLVRLAFELYATSDYTLERLADELADRGLRSRQTARRPSQPVSQSKIAQVLSNRYYLGLLTYKGEEYGGRHEPLVDQAVFDQVQRILAARRVRGERDRVHNHFLKGLLWCGRCHDKGRERRLLFTRNVGRRGGEYFYFFCAGLQDRTCTERYLPLDDVERHVAEYLAKIQFSADFVVEARQAVQETVADQSSATRLLHKQLSAQLVRLDTQEDNLLDLAAEGDAATRAKVRRRLNDIELSRRKVREQLDGVTLDLTVGAELVESALQVMLNPKALYERISDLGRRTLLQSIFEKLWVEEHGVSGDEMREPFREAAEVYRSREVETPSARSRRTTQNGGPSLDRRSWIPTWTGSLGASDMVRGSSKAVLVELKGIEPLTPSMPWTCSTN
jgi:site-specific DNA recombinase